jgi:hypothetical protein
MLLDSRSGIDAETIAGGGDAGTVRVKAGDLKIRNRAGIRTSTTGDGNAGIISIEAGDLELTNDAEISSGSGRLLGTGFLDVGQGNAGTIDINADNITLSDSRISTSTLGSGAGGMIKIHTPETLTLVDRAVIEAQTGGSGAGGNINIEATDIELNRDASIFAGSSGTGLAGQLFIKACDNLRLANGSQISVATTEADAGDIILSSSPLIAVSALHREIPNSVARW